MELAAKSWRLDEAPDLATIAGRHGQMFSVGGCGLAGRGVALRIDIPAPWVENTHLVLAALKNLASDSDRAPVAFGALPFDRTSSASMIVPELLVGADSADAHWALSISGDAMTYPPPLEEAPPAPQRIEIEAELPDEKWCALVKHATEKIRAGDLKKVVLTRRLECLSDTEFDQLGLLRYLSGQFSSSMVFAVEGFIGATPELLVCVNGDAVQSQPMAGTTPRSGDPVKDAQLAAALLASPKDLEEHQYTIDMVHDTLLNWCSYLDSGSAPEIHTVANLQHLASKVVGRLSEPYASALEIAAGLHPTPAVGGLPRQAALDLMNELEPSPRGNYAGPVGWMDANGNGEFGVGIRCAQLQGKLAILHAGVGVVADSDPAAELAETQVKFKAMLGALASL